tara:strand:- start:3 stop:257 length:255 start_codon:yes stop_codon:yes gene_type:complete
VNTIINIIDKRKSIIDFESLILKNLRNTITKNKYRISIISLSEINNQYLSKNSEPNEFKKTKRELSKSRMKSINQSFKPYLSKR